MLALAKKVAPDEGQDGGKSNPDRNPFELWFEIYRGNLSQAEVIQLYRDNPLLLELQQQMRTTVTNLAGEELANGVFGSKDVSEKLNEFGPTRKN